MILPRLEFRLPVISPITSSGIITSTSIIGSKITGLAFNIDSLKACRAAVELFLAGKGEPQTIRAIEEATRYDRIAGVLLKMHVGGTLTRHAMSATDVRYSLAKKPEAAPAKK